jgi:hypothetical protein
LRLECFLIFKAGDQNGIYFNLRFGMNRGNNDRYKPISRKENQSIEKSERAGS